MRRIEPIQLRALWLFVVVLVAPSGLAHAEWSSPTPLTDLLLKQGPYGSGKALIELEDTTRTAPQTPIPIYEACGTDTRALPTAVWYPSANRADDQVEGASPGATKNGFPLIVFGHGIASEGAEGAFVAAHLATHGYVVIAPDFPLSKGSSPCGPTPADIAGQAGDVIFLITAFQEPQVQATFVAASLIDFDRIGVLGYSLGGATMALAGSHPAIDAVATLAPATCPLYEVGVPTTIEKPLLILQGTTDAICKPTLNAEPFFDASGDPRHLVEIENGSHAGFLTSAPAIEAAYPTTPIDGVICYALSPLLQSDPVAQSCQVCNPPPSARQLVSTRQHELTRAGVLAFFNAYLRCRPLSLAYLRHVYDVENSELTTTYSGSPGVGLGQCIEQ